MRTYNDRRVVVTLMFLATALFVVFALMLHAAPLPDNPTSTTTTSSLATTTTTTTDKSAVKLWTDTATWNNTVKWNEAARAAAARTARPPARQSGGTTHYPASYAPCGGTDYPPCWRVGTESGGNYNAYNPNGCDGHGCYGKWQFSGAWACKLGLPCDIGHATPAQQDNAARLLWNHGAGCSNWAAC